jgi:hypothetical protein
MIEKRLVDTSLVLILFLRLVDYQEVCMLEQFYQ